MFDNIRLFFLHYTNDSSLTFLRNSLFNITKQNIFFIVIKSTSNGGWGIEESFSDYTVLYDHHQTGLKEKAVLECRYLILSCYRYWFLTKSSVHSATVPREYLNMLYSFGFKQCDQIGRFSKVLGEIFCFTSSPNVQWLLSYLKKPFQVTTALVQYLRQLLEKFGLFLISASGHTGCCKATFPSLFSSKKIRS